MADDIEEENKKRISSVIDSLQDALRALQGLDIADRLSCLGGAREAVKYAQKAVDLLKELESNNTIAPITH